MNRVPLAGKSLEGAAVLVTGGAGGLGRAVVSSLQARGARVVVMDVQGERARAMQRDLPDVHAEPGDVTCLADVKRAVSVAAELGGGKLRAAVCCAGQSLARETYNFFSKRPHQLEEFCAPSRVAIGGLFRVASVATPYLKGGVLVGVSGSAGLEGARGQAASSAACGGVAGAIQGLRAGLEARGVRAAVVSPGLFATPPLGHLPERIVSFLCRQGAWPERLGRPEELAHVVCMLLECDALAGAHRELRVDAANRLFPL